MAQALAEKFEGLLDAGRDDALEQAAWGADRAGAELSNLGDNADQLSDAAKKELSEALQEGFHGLAGHMINL